MRITASLLAAMVAIVSGCLFIHAESWKQNATYELSNIDLSGFLSQQLGLRNINDHGIDLGGIGSDLWHAESDGPGVYWMITDRGPNGEDPRTFPVEEFTPFILKVKTVNGAIEILDAIPVTGFNDARAGVTGIPNLDNTVEPPALNEAFFRCNGTDPLSPNPNGLDTEGLVRVRDGYFWVVEEYGPSLLKIDPQGRVVKRFFPARLLDHFNAPVTGYQTDDSVLSVPELFGLKRKLNRGFEGLAISPNQKTLFLALQSPLANPDLAAGNESRNTRILGFDIESERVVSEFVYRFQFTGPGRDDDEFDVPSIPGNTARARPRDMKISALSMLDQHRMLVLERTDFKAQIYLVDLRKATNILGTIWDDVVKSAPSLEQLNSDGALESLGIHPLPKELIITLNSIDGFPQKIEGMAVLDGKTIAIANDNDFGVGSFDLTNGCELVDSQRESQIIVIRLDKPIK